MSNSIFFNAAIILIALVIAGNHCFAQEKVTLKEADGSKKTTIDDFAWIAGHWKGEGMGGSFEETWNPPLGGTMLGMFKFINKEKIDFYEILTIVPKDDSFILRLKHFDSELVGWEDKDKAVEFPLVSISDTVAEFDGLKFVKISDDELHILVRIRNRAGETGELKFVGKRAK